MWSQKNESTEKKTEKQKRLQSKEVRKTVTIPIKCPKSKRKCSRTTSSPHWLIPFWKWTTLAMMVTSITPNLYERSRRLQPIPNNSTISSSISKSITSFMRTRRERGREKTRRTLQTHLSQSYYVIVYYYYKCSCLRLCKEEKSCRTFNCFVLCSNDCWLVKRLT